MSRVRGFVAGLLALMIAGSGASALERAPSWTSADTSIGRFCAFGDVDGDGRPDLAVVDGNLFPISFDSRVKLYRNVGGTLETTPSWQVERTGNTEHFNSLAFGDPDGDGDDDLVVDLGQQGLVLYEAANGTLSSQPVWTARDHAQGFQSGYDRRVLAWHDLDQDGTPELLAAWYRFLRVYDPVDGQLPDVADFQFSWTPEPRNPASHLLTFDVGDINGDDLLDVVVSYGRNPLVGGTNGIGVFLARRPFHYLATPDWQVSRSGNVSFADPDGDGDLDLVVGMDLYVNEGGTLRTTSLPHPEGNYALWVDLNGDGRYDAYVPRIEDDVVYLGSQTLPLQSVGDWKSADNFATGAAAVADVNGDGIVDVARAVYGERLFTKIPQPVVVHLGTGSFPPSGPPRVALAGYGSTDLAGGRPGDLAVSAFVSDPAADVTKVTLTLDGVDVLDLASAGPATPLQLFEVRLPGVTLAPASLRLGLRAEDTEWYRDDAWPTLSVAP